MKYLPTLTIAGSDSSGGAGLQADLKAMSALGCYAMSVVTAITAQNTCGVQGVHPIPPHMITLQCKAILEDIPPLAIKTGMLTNAEIIKAVADCLRGYPAPLVVDPLMVATSGDRLLTKAAEGVLREALLPLATLITPNLQEAEVLADASITSERSLREVGQKLLQMGTKAVLIKGGHTSAVEAVDYLFTPEGCVTFSHPRIESINTHGTGCTLSAAITAYLARGYQLPEAVSQGKTYLSEALYSGRGIRIGKGHGPVDHFFNPLRSIKQ